MKQAWVPYPAYTDRAAWDSLMGPNKQRLIAAGEKLLDYKWKLIPATAYLEYERSGNRKVMEAPYDANRQALNALMLAELAEGKGRFIDQLLNGAYMSCEMNSWVCLHICLARAVNVHFLISANRLSILVPVVMVL